MRKGLAIHENTTKNATKSKFKWIWPHLVDLAFGSTQYSNQVQMMKCPRRANLATKAKVPASLSFPIFWPQFLHIIPPYIYLPFLFYLANIFEVIASRLQYLHLDMDAMQDFYWCMNRFIFCTLKFVTRVLHFLFFLGHKRTYTFIYFQEKFLLILFYIINIKKYHLHVYWILRKPPTYTVIRAPSSLGTPE